MADYSKVTFINPNTSSEMSLEALKLEIQKKMDAQMIQLLQEGDKGNFTIQPQIQKKYEDEKKEKINYIVKSLAQTMTVSLLNEIIETAYIDFESKVSGVDPREIGGYFGEFIESEMLGLSRDVKPTADIGEIKTEVKAHSGKKNIMQIGIISVKTDIDLRGDEEARKLIILEKMISKMENLLFFKVEKTFKEGRVLASFPEISLYMTLIIKKLYDMLYNNLQSGVWAEEGHWNPNTKSKSYNIKLSMSKIGDVYRFAQLYLYNIDLLHSIKEDSGFRNNFFGLIRHLKLTSFGSEKNPDFSINFKL